MIERAVIISSDGVLRLPEPLVQATTAPASESEASKEPMTISTLDEAEREHILRALEATGWRIDGTQGRSRHAQAPSVHLEIPHEKTRPDQGS